MESADHIPIEDDFEDVLQKAMRGHGLTLETLAQRVELPMRDIRSLLEGNYASGIARLVARQLSLNHHSLHELATKPIRPNCRLPDCIQLHNAPFPVPGYEEMTVNSYSVRLGKDAQEGLLFDVGSCFKNVFGAKSRTIRPGWHLFLTHTDPDHITKFAKLAKIVAHLHAPVDEPYGNALPVRVGELYKWGGVQVTALQTVGHSPGGMSYLLEGVGRPIAFVGDAIFCYSIGKVRGHYDSALAQIQSNILGLPGETILCPGHGPITTVEFERRHNPFFALRDF